MLPRKPSLKAGGRQSTAPLAELPPNSNMSLEPEAGTESRVSIPPPRKDGLWCGARAGAGTESQVLTFLFP